MEKCLLSVFATPDISARSPGSIQSFCVAEKDSVYLVEVPRLTRSNTQNPCPGKPTRLQAGFQSPSNTKKLFSFSSGVSVESLTTIEQGIDTWKILACTGIGEVFYYEAGGQKFELSQETIRPHSWAQSLQLPTLNNIATVHQTGKMIRVDDVATQTCLMNLPTVFYPSSITPYDDKASPCFITTEYNQVCVWDIRQSNPAVHRYQASADWLYASAIRGNLVAVGGKNRIIEITDLRKWKFQSRWTNCLKYEVTSILFSEQSEELCFVAGVDSELVCGRWRNNQAKGEAKGSFRADSRWGGFSLLKGTDLLAGYNENGNLYVFDNASHLYPSYTGEALSKSIGIRKNKLCTKKEGPPAKKTKNK